MSAHQILNRNWTFSATAILLGLFGATLFIGGAWLLFLGGSAYYLILGVGLLISSTLAWHANRAACWLVSVLLLGTLLWAVLDAGMDIWQILTRCGLLVIVALWLVVLPVFGLRDREDRRRFGRSGQAALVAAVVISATVAGVAKEKDPYDIQGALPAATLAPISNVKGVPDAEWRSYGRDAFGQRYSPLKQVTATNANQLQKVWEYHTGDIRQSDDVEETTYEVTPLKVGDLVYLCTPHDLVMALEASTGKERWRYDPQVPPRSNGRQHQTCRGLSYDEDSSLPAGQPCAHRIFLPTADARLVALDAATGTVCTDFAEKGTLNLWANMPNVKDGFYYSTSAPVITKDLVVVGGAVDDNVSTAEPSGVVRAFDIHSGRLVWNWDAKRPTDTKPIAPGQTYSANSPNVWSTMSVDEDLRIVYLPVGNQMPDQWGGNRDAMTEKFASSITALSLDTGEVKWVFQAVHHDLWDMDVPAQPSLIDLNIDGQTVPALVQATKQGDIYVLDRRTGKPVLPVTEAPAPQGAATGDHSAPTQPYSALRFRPHKLEEHDMWGATPIDQMICRIQFHRLRYEGRYTPPSTQGSIIYPGNFGTFNWGGVAVDPTRQSMFAMPVYLAFVSRLVPRENASKQYVSDKPPGLNENFGAPFAAEMKPFTSPVGLPCQAPPWGYVAGADLRTGAIAWKHRNGTVRDLSPLPLPFKMGVPGIGGPIMTAGGVAFLSGSLDNYVRAYDVTTGRQLWQSRLPAGGQATPMTYEQGGRQYVLVVAGGHGSTGTKKGDAIIAYALPQH